jgi:MoaA/NifB/PqqE/SkfB family radical SAM enzyme
MLINPGELSKKINVDITTKCNLKCLSCKRQLSYSGKLHSIPGKDMSIEEMGKITDYFDVINMSGSASDPSFHPDLKSLLKVCSTKNKKVTVHIASSYRDKSWFRNLFLFSKGKNISYIFALDGLPEESHKYRINQDGKKLFEIMKMCASMDIPTYWQCIVFNYNEDHIEECRILSEKHNIKFMKVISSRWSGEMFKYRPKNQENYYTRDFEIL